MRISGNSKMFQTYGDDSFAMNDFTYTKKYVLKDYKLFLKDYNEYFLLKLKIYLVWIQN